MSAEVPSVGDGLREAGGPGVRARLRSPRLRPQGGSLASGLLLLSLRNAPFQLPVKQSSRICHVIVEVKNSAKLTGADFDRDEAQRILRNFVRDVTVKNYLARSAGDPLCWKF